MTAVDHALVLYDGTTALERATAWTQLNDDERRRQAVQAAHQHDADALWHLTEVWLTLHSRKGARISPLTLRNYRQCLVPPQEPKTEKERARRQEEPPLSLLPAWRDENLLRPSRLAGARWLRQLGGRGYKTSTVRIYLGAGRALYSALRSAGATTADPFKDLYPAPDPTPRHEKRRPYSDDEVERLLAVTQGPDRLLVLLGAHAGLRVSEMVSLRWDDADLDGMSLIVRSGKGGKKRTVPLGATLAGELARQRPNGSAYVLPYDVAAPVRGRGRPPTRVGSPTADEKRKHVWYQLKTLCKEAGVPFAGKAVHGLRHTSGTRLWTKTENVRHVMEMLGHSDPSTALIYSQYSDETLRKTVQDW